MVSTLYFTFITFITQYICENTKKDSAILDLNFNQIRVGKEAKQVFGSILINILHAGKIINFFNLSVVDFIKKQKGH